VHRVPVAEGVEVATEGARRSGPHLAREAERGTGCIDRLVGGEERSSRNAGGAAQRIDLEARETGEAEACENAGALGVRALELGWKGGSGYDRRRFTGRSRLSQPLLGELGVV